MASAVKTESTEHEKRRKRFTDTFNNAAEVLEKYRKSSFYKSFPQDDRAWELRSQFMMAHALNDLPRQRTRLLDKIHDYLTPEQRTRFTPAYMRNQYTLGNYIDQLVPGQPE